jgi:hypothetical protein
VSAPVASDDELATRRPRRTWRLIVVRTLLALLALLLVMTAFGLVAGVHATGGAPYRPPVPRPTIPGDMHH